MTNLREKLVYVLKRLKVPKNILGAKEVGKYNLLKKGATISRKRLIKNIIVRSTIPYNDINTRSQVCLGIQCIAILAVSAQTTQDARASAKLEVT